MIEVFRRKKRFYLVFEYLDHTLLNELENAEGGLGLEMSKRYIYQVLRGLDFCHNNNVSVIEKCVKKKKKKKKKRRYTNIFECRLIVFRFKRNLGKKIDLEELQRFRSIVIFFFHFVDR